MTKPRNVRLTELDALRGLAALAVGLYHFTVFLPNAVPGTVAPSVGFSWGCYGVQVFFAISGFVILGTLERSRGLGAFALARGRRLFPEYWLATILTAGVAALFGPAILQVGVADWVENLPMMQLLTGVPMVDGAYWTLNVEIGFYVAMAIAWRLGWTRRIETVVLVWLALKWLNWTLPGRIDIVTTLLFDQAAYFSVGLVAYRVWTGERRWYDQLPVLAATFGTVMLLDPIHAHVIFAGLAPGFLVIATGYARWLSHPWLLWMGAISYPFYLLHATIGYAVIYQLEGIGTAPAIAALAALLATGMLAWAMASAFAHGRRWRGRLPETTAAPLPA